jgi:uracil-DNA glycosylase
VRAQRTARLLIAGQAPGRRVHETGIPFNDPSGDRLRDWLGLSREAFYDESRVAIIPMGFCYPGTGANGDLPPRPECAVAWRAALLAQLPKVELTLIIGRYAQGWHLPDAGDSVTEVVRNWRRWWPAVLPLPHPSPRNNLWLKRNPWFELELLPVLQRRIRRLAPG